MADTEGLRPIIVVKRRKKEAAHHGGAWKVAYADFVTAMMAFFMVMWLVTAVSKEQRAALFEYFKNPSMERGNSVKASPGQMGPGGASTSVIDLGGGLDAPRTASQDQTEGLGQPVEKTSVEAARRIAEEAERKQLESLENDLRAAIENSQALEPFKDQLLLDITPEGLRIQIVDKQNRPMFDSGSSALKDYTIAILRELPTYLNSVPNRISISGHTDAQPYVSRGNSYTNWELSADRANAARRSLIAGGLQPEKFARVVGLASSVLFDRRDSHNPINRRISIIVMTKRAEEAALATDAPLQPPQAAVEPLPGEPPAAATVAAPDHDAVTRAAAAAKAAVEAATAIDKAAGVATADVKH
jgi:chemotaxis protein MotB